MNSDRFMSTIVNDEVGEVGNGRARVESNASKITVSSINNKLEISRHEVGDGESGVFTSRTRQRSRRIRSKMFNPKLIRVRTSNQQVFVEEIRNSDGVEV